MKIILTGGGTGGHILPLIAVAKKIKEQAPDAEFLFMGPRGKLEKELMDGAGIPTKAVMVGKMRRYFSLLNFLDFFKMPVGVLQALWILLIEMPDIIFSKGGYASVPAVVAGWIYRIPILIHESDSVPGLANEILGKLSDRVAVSYPEAEKNFSSAQVVLTGNPLREDIAAGDPDAARKMFGFSEAKKIIFVWGGSQGAKSINDKTVNILPELLRKYYVIHQTGEKSFEDTKRRAGELGIKAGHGGYCPVAFIGDELKHILAAADLIISRAGANSISEIAANGKPAIIIPISKFSNGHQLENAFSLAKMEACIVLEESNLGENLFLSRIEEIMNNEELRKKLSENIKNFYHADAAERIAEGILSMIK